MPPNCSVRSSDSVGPVITGPGEPGAGKRGQLRPLLQILEKTEAKSSVSKGTFLSEDTDDFVITSNRQTFFFPETENLNFGDRKLLRS